jgi:TonB family protein
MSSCAAFAQTQSPAQPASTPTLLASLHRPVVSSTSSSPAPAPADAAVSTSTGVTPPELLGTADYLEDTSEVPQIRRQLRTVVLDLTVDEKGKVAHVKVLASNDPMANPGVIRAVSQFRYQPAQLDGVAVPFHLKLTYNINPVVED